MSSRVVHVLNAPYRAIPDGLGFRATSPIIRWGCKYAAEEGETVEYDGRGTITYVGDDDERQMGRTEASISVIPGVLWMAVLFLFTSSAPRGLISALISFGLCGMLLVSMTVMGEVEINAVDEVHHL